METISDNYWPQLIDESEALLGAPFFDNPLDYNATEIAMEDLGFRQAIYRSVCRVVAESRADDRSIEKEESGHDSVAWNDRWLLTSKKIADIALRHSEQVSFLSRQLALNNAAQTYVDQNWDELKVRLRPKQREYVFDVMSSLNRAPRTIEYECVEDGISGMQRYTIFGTTVVAPTGFGKTRLIETFIKMYQPGKQIEQTQYGKTPVRIVLVSPSMIITKQNTDTLRQALPGVRVGSLHSRSHEVDADVVVASIGSFIRHFDNGKLAGNPVDVVMVDEAHHLAQPQFRKIFIEHWRGQSIVFTATPAYDLARDVRNIIPHVVKKQDIIQSMEDGTLNDAQVLTFVIGPEEYTELAERYREAVEAIEITDEKFVAQEIVDSLVIDFMMPLLEEGRRGMVFCKPGHDAHFARRLATRLRGKKLSTGKKVRAGAMYATANNQDPVVQAFRKGEIDVITTVDSGREGLDLDCDFVIVNCRLQSPLRAQQIVGRGTRPSKRFPVTIYGQFMMPPVTSWHRKDFSIEEVFGGDVLKPGTTIRSQLRHWLPAQAVNLPAFPDFVKDILQKTSNTPIGDVFVGVNRGKWSVKLGSIPLQEMLAGLDTTEKYAKSILQDAGFARQAKYVTVNGSKKLTYFYMPEAKKFLKENLPKIGTMSHAEVAEFFDIPLTAVHRLAKQAGVTGRLVMRGKGKRPLCYDPVQIEAMAKEHKKIVGTQPGDMSLVDLANELDIRKFYLIKFMADPKRPKLRNLRHLTAAEVATARQAFKRIKMAGPGEMNMTGLSKASGVSREVIEYNMTDEERRTAKPRRYKDARGFLRETPHWSPEMSSAIIERMKKFKTRPLPRHLLPIKSARAFVRNLSVTPLEEIERILVDGDFVIEEVLIIGAQNMCKCISWRAIQHLRAVLGEPKKATIKFDFSLLPDDANDRDVLKMKRAYFMQLRFLEPYQLAKDHTETT